MENQELGDVLKGIHTLFGAGSLGTFADGPLLDRVVGSGGAEAEAAFAALVERHGPMVLRLCRGVLRDSHDAEDAFQATFLILARRAGSIRKGGSVACWLYGVARRVAIRAKAERARRAEHERRGAAMADRARVGGLPELLPEVQEEVDRLPEKYRAPVVLCDLEGLTHEEAAGQLRVPVGTVKVRLSRARQRLRGRLARRGLAPALLATAAVGRASAAMPAPLVNSTIKAAVSIAAGRAAGVSTPVAALVKGGLRTMLLARMKPLAAILAASLTLVIATTLVLSTLPRPVRSGPVAGDDQDRRAIAEPKGEPIEAPAPVVEMLRRSALQRATTQPGTAEAFQSADLYPAVTGYLSLVNVDIGDAVKRGQVLAEIDAPELDAERDESRALVERARAQLMKAKAQVDVDQAEASALAGEVIADREARLRVAMAKVAVAKADLEGARANVRVAEAGLRKAEVRAAQCKIASPLDGIVSSRSTHVGQYVRPGNESRSAPLFTVVDTSRLRVVVRVPDRDVPRLDQGDPATIHFDALPGRDFRGKVARVAPAEDPEDRTLRAEVDLDNPDGALRPGMYGAVHIILNDRPDVLTIPASAIVERSAPGAATCFRVVEGRAVLTRVKLGEDDGGRVEVFDGLKEGDAVLANPAPGLQDGQPIARETPDTVEEK